MLVPTVSLLTCLIALIGFFSTTILAWRREKRDKLHLKLDLEKKQLEIDKLRKELEGS